MSVKVNNPECIKNSETLFMRELRKGFDWRTVRTIFKQQYHLNMLKAISTRQGDVVVVNQQVAYKIDFKVMVPLSIFFDRAGNYIALTPMGETVAKGGNKASTHDVTKDTAAESQKRREEVTAYDLLPSENREGSADGSRVDPKKNISQMTNKIASMISEINGKQ